MKLQKYNISLIILTQPWNILKNYLGRLGYVPLSNTNGAFGPRSMDTAPAPPVARAEPRAYIATSAATTIASLPENCKLLNYN